MPKWLPGCTTSTSRMLYICSGRQSFATPKILCILRTVLCCFSPVLATFDQELYVLNPCQYQPGQPFNLDTCRPSCWAREIRKATQLTPAFLAYAAGCKDIYQILPDRLKDASCPKLWRCAMSASRVQPQWNSSRELGTIPASRNTARTPQQTSGHGLVSWRFSQRNLEHS